MNMNAYLEQAPTTVRDFGINLAGAGLCVWIGWPIAAIVAGVCAGLDLLLLVGLLVAGVYYECRGRGGKVS